MPTVVQDHQFTYSNGTSLSGLAGDVGGNLTLTGGTAEVQSNRAVFTNNAAVAQTPSIGTADYTLRVVVRALTTGINVPAIEARNNGTTTFYVLIGNANAISLNYYDGATGILIGSAYSWTPSATTDYTVDMICSGNEFTVKLDGSTIIGPVSYTGNSATTGVKFYVSGSGSTSSTGWHFDRVTVETPDAGGNAPRSQFYHIQGMR
jgi:hypothetical protein